MRTLRIRKRPNLKLYLYREYIDGKPVKEESKASLKSLQKWFNLNDNTIGVCELLKDGQHVSFYLDDEPNEELVDCVTDTSDSADVPDAIIETLKNISDESVSEAVDLNEEILKDIYNTKTFDEMSSDEKIKSLQEEIVNLNALIEEMRFDFEKKLNRIKRQNLNFAQEKNKIIFNIQLSLKKFKLDSDIKQLLKNLNKVF